MNRNIPLEELKFCLKIWEEKNECNFSSSTKCDQCTVPYTLLKTMDGISPHGKNMEKLNLNDWKERLKQYEN